MRKNDSGSSGDIPASDSRFRIISSHGGIAGNVIGAVNFVLPLVANDYIHAEEAETSPPHPSIPGIICTVVQVASA